MKYENWKVFWCVAETPESVPFVRITSPPVSMSEPPKLESRNVESNQILGDSLENIIKDLDHVSKDSVVRTSTVKSKIGHDKKVGIWFCMCQLQNENAITLKIKSIIIWFENFNMSISVFISNEIEILEPQCYHRIFWEVKLSILHCGI
jgi:hypothetical protein